MADHPVLGDYEPVASDPGAQALGCQAVQAGAVHQASGPARRAAKPEPVKRRPAAGFKIWLIPHGVQFGLPPSRDKAVLCLIPRIVLSP